MLPSKLDLKGRDAKDLQREFTSFLIKVQALKEKTGEEREVTKESLQGDANGWANFFMQDIEEILKDL